MTAAEIIALLDLRPHPAEGGYFKETYRSDESILPAGLPARYRGRRDHGTCIYYLLTPDTFSAMHRLASDEIFHFYVGDPVEMLQLTEDGRGARIVLGSDFKLGQSPQVIVRRGIWQGSRLCDGGAFALLGTTVAPGFDFADYEHGDRTSLAREFPTFSDQIVRLTH